MISKHLRAADELTAKEISGPLAARFASDLSDLKEVLRGVWHGRGHSERTMELVSGYGEIWSAQLIDAAIRTQGGDSTWLDAREVLVVEPDAVSAKVNWKISRQRLHAWLETHPQKTIVVTGFIIDRGWNSNDVETKWQ